MSNLPQLVPSARGQARRAAVGSYLGATLEFYDFVLYSTASALVFPTVFFAGVDQGLGVILSYATLAVGYLARPVGAALFGHFGDRLGRKRMLLATMLLMGIASIGIGLIPSASQIGPAAAVILVAFRLVQGVAVGGEWAGASLMSIEHATEHKRGMAGGIVQSGGPTGAVLATLTFALVSLLPREQFLDWGWRIPFTASLIVVIAALIIRLGVDESPEFLADKQRQELPRRIPLVSTFRENWRSIVLVVISALTPFFLQSLTATFVLQFAVQSGTPQPTALLLLTVSNLLTIGGTLLFAGLSDRIGRITVMVGGLAASGASIWIVFALLGRPEIWAVLLAFVLLQAVCNAAVTGPLASYMASLFPVRNRFTGVGLSYQIAAALAAGFAPLLAAGLVGAAGGGTALLSAFITALAAVGIVAVLASRSISIVDRTPTEPQRNEEHHDHH